MALLFIDSFDHYKTADLLAKWTNGSGTIVAGIGRCNTQGLRLGGIEAVSKGVAFANARGIVGFAYRCDVQAATSAVFVTFNTAGGAGRHVYLARNADGSIEVWRSDGAPVIIAVSAPDILRLTQYYFIEFRLFVDNAAGEVEVKVNGATVISFTGDTFADVATLAITGIGFLSVGNTQSSFDDVYALDETGAAPWNTFLGDCRVEALRPDGLGVHQEWDLFGAATHWQAVDDAAAPNGDTSYLFTATQGLQETETFSPTGLPTGSIFGLQISLYARKTDAGPRVIAPVLRQGITDAIGQNRQPGLTYVYQIQLFQLNPVTGLAWTIADVNALEAGVVVTV